MLLTLLAQSPAAPAKPSPKPLVVASKVDSEGALLGQMILQLLRARGVPVVDKTEFAPTALARAALLRGEIELYPEYIGNGALFYPEARRELWRDRQRSFQELQRRDGAANDLVWLEPAPADNPWALAVRSDFAKKNRLVSLRDLARFLKGGGAIKLAGSAEFLSSPGALPAFQKTYGFTVDRAQTVTFAGGNSALTERAAALGIDGVNVTMAHGTDGGLHAYELTLLTDPERAQPVYAPAVVIRRSALARFPGVRTPLENLFRGLTSPVLRALNARMLADGLPAPRVAREYLQAAGFLKR